MRWLALLTLLVACDAPGPSDVTLVSDGATLRVRVAPLGFALWPKGVDPSASPSMQSLDPVLEVGTTSFGGKRYYPDPLAPMNQVSYVRAQSVTSVAGDGNGAKLTLAGDDGKTTLVLTVAPEGDGSFAFSVTATAPDPVVHVRLHLAAQGGEHFYGLGEWFDSVDQRGKLRDVHFQLDTTIESSYNEVHVPVPAYVSTAGYGVFLDNREPLVADMASQDAGVHLTVVAPALAGHLFAMGSPVAAVARMQRLAGLPKLWPAWQFAPMQWRDEDPVTCTVPCAQGCNASSTGADVVRADVAAMRAHKLPGSLIWLDAPWERAFNDFTLNPVQFPDGKKLLDDLHALGYQVAVWASPFVDDADDSATECGMVGADGDGLYAEGAAKGYFVTGADGRPVHFPWRGTSGAQVDLTNPDAYAWWKGLVHRITDLGVVGFKLDWDEYIVANLVDTRPDLRFHDGSTVATEHAVMHELFHKAHEEALEESGGPGFILARSGDASDAKYASTVWPGDLDNDFTTFRTPGKNGVALVGGLPDAVNAAVSLAASAHPHFGSDIGGLRHGLPTKEVMARWSEFGALSTVMELGGGGVSHNVWDFSVSDFDEELLDIYARYARLHMSLFPYLYSYVKASSVDGTPILRAPALMYPGDAALAAATYEYFFGDDLLVAPVVVDHARARSVTFPDGRWVDWWTGAVVSGPATMDVQAPLDTLPLYARAGAIVPLLSDDVDTLAPATDPSVVTAEMRAGELGVRLFPDGDHSFAMYDGTTFHAVTTAGQVSLSVAGAPLGRRYTVTVAWALVGSAPPTTVARASGGPVAQVADATAFAAADEGWYYDAATGEAHVKARMMSDTMVLH